MDAGWYNDPFGRFAQRYHDGDEWTEHVSAGDGRSFPDPSGNDPFVSGPAPTGTATWAPPTATDAKGRPVDLASPWLRIAATILDFILFSIPLGFLFLNSVDWEGFDFEGGETIDVPASVILISVVVPLIYQVLMVGRFSRTLGQMACGVRVAAVSDRSDVGWATATIRAVATLAYQIPFLGIGFILLIVSFVMLFADGKRQTIHDKVAKTVVVMAR